MLQTSGEVFVPMFCGVGNMACNSIMHYAKIDSFLLSLNFVRCKSDPNVYLKLFNGSLMIIVLYDLLITGSSKDEIASLKGAMNQAFSMTDLELLSQFLGLEIAQTKDGIRCNSPIMPWTF